MKNIHLLYCILLSAGLCLFGCTTIPILRAPQPWVRSLNSAQEISPSSKLKISVAGTTYPLLGKEELTAEKIKERLSYLLTRRGFTIDNYTTDYSVQLNYKSEISSRSRTATNYAENTHSSYGILGSIATASGLGVSIARALNSLSTSASSEGVQINNQLEIYTHTLSIEISTTGGKVIWKGESTWNSEALDIISQFTPAVQILLSDLPSAPQVYPQAGEIKSTHVLNYYKLECEGNWFSCPALPYRIRFYDGKVKPEERNSIPDGIENPVALAAYVDLIQTAEFALPDGDTQDWNDPLQAFLWRRVTLGGHYLLGPNSTPTNIIITMRGTLEGYVIDKCKTVSDEEYSAFTKRLSNWQKTLTDYYDVYEK